MVPLCCGVKCSKMTCHGYLTQHTAGLKWIYMNNRTEDQFVQPVTITSFIWEHYEVDWS